MASIWNDIEITWDDETYVVTPTMEFINFLEKRDGRSLSRMLVRLSNQDLPSGQACELIADTINWAGGKVDAMDVMRATAGLNQDAISLAYTILTGCMPEPANKPTAKKKTAAKKTAKKK